MTTAAPDISTPAVTPLTDARSARWAQLARFARISLVFLAGLAVTIKLCDLACGRYLKKTRQPGGLGQEVQIALDAFEHKRPKVRTIVIGDSVSRQLFQPGSEQSPSVCYLTTNQAISLAGQYYLVARVLKHAPNVKDVYLFYLPAAWENDMPREYTHDYLCGHFHSTAEVIEVFRVKRDVELSVAHLTRWAMPNLMAINSLTRPAASLNPHSQGSARVPNAPAPPDPEHLLTSLSQWMGPAPAAATFTPDGKRAILLSNASQYYLPKLHALCAARGVRLHVLPCPVSDEKNHCTFADTEGIYDAPMIHDVPADQLIDYVHFKAPFVAAARWRLLSTYRLYDLEPTLAH